MPSTGGTTKTVTENKLPEELEGEAKANLELVKSASQLGPVYNQGPQMAMHSPQQIAGLQNLNLAQRAFGLPSVGNSRAELTGIPDSMVGTDPATGMQGYTATPSFEAHKANIPAAQKALIESFFMDPTTGAPPVNAAVTESPFNVAAFLGEQAINNGETPAPTQMDALRAALLKQLREEQEAQQAAWKKANQRPIYHEGGDGGI